MTTQIHDMHAALSVIAFDSVIATWLIAHDPQAFDQVCHALRLDPDYLRKRHAHPQEASYAPPPTSTI